MKTLSIPFLPVLDELDLSSAEFLMEAKAHRDFINTVNWSEYPHIPICAFDIARGTQDIYLHFFVRENSSRATCEIDGGPIQMDSNVSFSFKTSDECHTNFSFNCLATCDAAQYDCIRRVPLPYDKYSVIRRHTTVKSKPFNEKLGIFIWELTVAVPFELIGLDPDNMPEKIYGNFCKRGEKTALPHFLSWEPILTPELNLYHSPFFFGEINL